MLATVYTMTNNANMCLINVKKMKLTWPAIFPWEAESDQVHLLLSMLHLFPPILNLRHNNQNPSKIKQQIQQRLDRDCVIPADELHHLTNKNI